MIGPWKKPKLEFINTIEGVAELMPMISATKHRHPWVDRAVADFAEVRKNPHWRNERMVHTARCPGVFTLQRHGWILRTWQDIEITTNGDGNSFTWRSPSAIGGDAIGFHPAEQLANYFEDWPTDTLRTVLKIHTGWRCNVPKGYYLLEMPVALSDESRFTTVAGYFFREAGPASMNVQLLWHVMNGKTLIRAGTPIAQYVLVPKDQPDMVCRDAQPKDRLQLSELMDQSRWVKNFSEVKKLFGA